MKPISCALVAVCLGLLPAPTTARAHACDTQRTYGAYALCCISHGKKPMTSAAWVRSRPIEIVAVDETPGSPLAREPYRAERARHERLRDRAEALSKHPRMSRYVVRAAELRIEDDRQMKKFDLQAKPAGGSAAALPGLKRHTDELETMVNRAQSHVDR